jgi:hypothetical protein
MRVFAVCFKHECCGQYQKSIFCECRVEDIFFWIRVLHGRYESYSPHRRWLVGWLACSATKRSMVVTDSPKRPRRARARAVSPRKSRCCKSASARSIISKAGMTACLPIDGTAAKERARRSFELDASTRALASKSTFKHSQWPSSAAF